MTVTAISLEVEAASTKLMVSALVLKYVKLDIQGDPSQFHPPKLT